MSVSLIVSGIKLQVLCLCTERYALMIPVDMIRYSDP